ncbi:MAG: hypothetical protein AB8B57_04745 [Congregibacter sp.]
MDLALGVFGILGLGAALIAAYVFAAAAKRYITGEDLREEMQAMQSDLSPYRHWVDRSDNDRRMPREEAVFPITVNGVLIREDRRRAIDRRNVA